MSAIRRLGDKEARQRQERAERGAMEKELCFRGLEGRTRRIDDGRTRRMDEANKFPQNFSAHLLPVK